MVRARGPAGGAARPRGGAEGDRGDPRSGGVPAAEAGVRVHGRDGQAVAARAGIATARLARVVVRRGPVRGGTMVARPGTIPGPLAAHAARLAEEGLAPGPSGRRPGRAMGGVGGRVRTGPPAGVEGVPADVAVPGAIGRIAGPGTASRMTASVPSRCPPGGTDASHNFLLGGYCARLIENACHWSLDVTFREDDVAVSRAGAGVEHHLAVPVHVVDPEAAPGPAAEPDHEAPGLRLVRRVPDGSDCWINMLVCAGPAPGVELGPIPPAEGGRPARLWGCPPIPVKASM